jgi:hypothetical protein
MNKLFIIGNGFDLAHGLKTSYHHFILWYFNQAIDKFNSGEVCSDKFIIRTRNLNQNIQKIESIEYLKSFLNDKGRNPFLFNNTWSRPLIYNLLSDNWVDFEILYYEIIKEITSENSFSKTEKIGSIASINEIFDLFKSKFIEYLRTIEIKELEVNGLAFYNNIAEEASKDRNKYSALMLNFNYTDTIDKILNYNFPNNPKHFFNFSKTINIHGKLNSIKNPIIFGYGDEMDDGYTSLEKLNNNEVLRFMKSFGYLINNNYKYLESFINTDFDVHILGHSCGLSDRLLLNEIFESKGCKNIYFHCWKKSETENNFIDITMNISRCFNDKTSMRKKVRSFEECVPFIIE